MGLHSGDKRCSNLLALLLALAVAMALPPSLGNAQKAHSKLTSQDIVDLLTADTSSDDVAKTAQEEGILSSHSFRGEAHPRCGWNG